MGFSRSNESPYLHSIVAHQSAKMPSSRKDTRRVAQRRIVQDATCMKRKLPCDVDTDSNQTVKILPDRTKDVLEPELADIHLTDDTSTNETNKRRNMEQQSWDTLEYRWTEGQDLPEGWDDEEDLEEDDFEMRIARYKRRILQNIMPGYFEVKKEGLEKRINIIAYVNSRLFSIKPNDHIVKYVQPSQEYPPVQPSV